MDAKEPEGGDDEQPHREQTAEVGSGPRPEAREWMGSVPA